MKLRYIVSVLFAVFWLTPALAIDPCNCEGNAEPGGPCYSGPGGPAYDGPGGPCYDSFGGPCYSGKDGTVVRGLSQYL